jgi:dTDP-4-amino-4,6-dideoxygalactose transaminase
MIHLFEPVVTEAHINTARNALVNEKFVDGESTRKFKTMLRMKFGRDYCSTCNSGTSALMIAIRAATELGYISPKKDTICTTPLSFIATSAAIHYNGYKIKWMDTDNYGIMEPPVDKSPIVPVALYGKEYIHANDYEGINIEDDAQAHGAHNTNALVNCFSFYTTKNLSVDGNGGAILTDDKKMYEVIESLINSGRTDKMYEHKYISSSYRMNNINAALGVVNLKMLHDQTVHRRFLAASYNSAMKGIKGLSFLTEPVHNHTFHLYVIRVPSEIRNKLRIALNEKGIQTGVHYPILIPHQPAFKQYDLKFPVAEKMVKEIISLPMHNKLQYKDVIYVSNCIRDLLGYGRV